VSAIVHDVHSIWLARNVVRFTLVVVSLHATMAKFSSLVAMSGTASKGNCLSNNVTLL